MAINRLDYKYVHNTLPTSKEDISDRNLKVGSKVENLLPVLSDDTVYNPELDYYADRDASRCWGIIIALTGEVKTTVQLGSLSGGNSYWTSLETRPSLKEEGGTYQLPTNAQNIYITKTPNASASQIGNSIQWRVWQSYNSGQDAESDPETGIIYYSQSYSGGSVSVTFTQPNSSAITSSDKNLVKQKGQLIHVVDLDNTKQYVVQVVNAYNSTEKNKIILLDSNNKETSTSYEFDNYLCFTPKESGTYAFKINGLSFGCKVYGLDSNNNVIELRNYVAPSTAQVYLFESDKPWMVDIDGTITGMSESAATTSASATTVKATLDSDKIKSMFSAAPSLTINSNGNLVVSVEGIDTTLWNGLSSKPEIYLLTYRDYLTNEGRVYNGIKTKNRRGLIRSIQKTSIPYRLKEDKFDPNEKEKINYQLSLIEVSNTLNYTFAANTNVDRTEAKPIAFDIIPLLGYNYSYCGENLHYNDENRFKYTSICFAWGIKNSNNKFEVISNFSIPVIVERNIEQSSFTGKFTTEKNTDYYNEDSIYYIKSE